MAAAPINPLFGSNRLKLGTFGTNGPGVTFTRAADLFEPSWDNALAMARAADEAGYEAIVPYARWHPFGNPQHNTGRAFETYTWAAGLAAATQGPAILATSHVPVLHPIVAAKQAMTIDHISRGRFALNIVCGWLKPEMAMFGVETLDHDARYAHADEWISAIKRLWSETAPIDFEGEYIRMAGAVALPKPLQSPRPPLMNAGGSSRGQAFAAEHCDIAFVMPREMSKSAIAEQVAEYRKLARDRFGRDLRIWVHSIVVHGPDRKTAEAELHRRVVDEGDDEAADAFIRWYVPDYSKLPSAAQKEIRFSVMAGAGGARLLGNAEDIAETLAMLSEAGIEGVLLGWVDYLGGIARFNREVLPLLHAAGLRAPPD